MKDLTPIDAGKLNRYVDDYAVEIVAKYFKSGTYTGGWFDHYAGGGDRPETANRFEDDDIVAVSFLGARLPGRAAYAILEDRSEEFGDLLTQIPGDVDLWDAPDEMLGPDSPARQLLERLVELPGMTFIAATKLLARKRPRLLPAYDRVLKVTLDRGNDDDWWIPLKAALTTKSNFVKTLTKLREDSEVGTDISILRVLHAAIWMREVGRPEPAPDADF